MNKLIVWNAENQEAFANGADRLAVQEMVSKKDGLKIMNFVLIP